MDPYWQIVAGLPTTLALSVIAMLLGCVAGAPLMLARRSRHRILRLPARALIDLFRAVPPIAWLFIFFFGLAEQGVQLSPFGAAAVALGAITAAYVAEIYRGGLMSIGAGQWQAGAALGLRRRDVYRDVLAPQVIRVALPALATYGIGLFKDTSIAYTIGVNEILFRANHEAEIASAPSLAILAAAGGLYILISLPTAYATRALDARLRARVAS